MKKRKKDKLKMMDSYMKYVEKLIYEYNNDKIKVELRKTIKLSINGIVPNMQKIIKRINLILDKMIENQKKNKTYSFYQIDKEIYHFGTMIKKSASILFNFFTVFTDIYTVRRLLDKDYIKTAIVYTGTAHTQNLANILVNNFKFKITDKFSQDKSYLKIDKKHLQKYIKDDFNSSTELINTITQCIDISKFRKPLI